MFEVVVLLAQILVIIVWFFEYARQEHGQQQHLQPAHHPYNNSVCLCVPINETAERQITETGFAYKCVVFKVRKSRIRQCAQQASMHVQQACAFLIIISATRLEMLIITLAPTAAVLRSEASA